MSPSIDPSQWSYSDYVCFLRSHGFHHLKNLDEYLSWKASARKNLHFRQPRTSRIKLLEYLPNESREAELTDTAQLRSFLRDCTQPNVAQPTAQGRTILIEDISPELVDILGGQLEIDPGFFASHIEGPSASNTESLSSTSTLASNTTRHDKEFFNMEYICTFTIDGCGRADVSRLFTQGNYRRKVEVVSKYGKQKIALVRRKISCFMRRPPGGPFICLILVDPPVSAFTICDSADYQTFTPAQQFEISGWQGGYLDFIKPTRPISRTNHDFRDCQHSQSCPNPFNELPRHFDVLHRDFPALFTNTTENLGPFFKPCFQLAASECANLFDYIRFALESQTINSLSSSQPLIKRQLDLCIFLDTLLSRYKPQLSRMKEYVRSVPDLAEDYRQLLIDLHHYRSECDAQMSHIQAISQFTSLNTSTSLLGENTRQGDYVRYITILILLYAPFALACAIFSMPEVFAPSRHYIYIFVPVVVVVTCLFLVLVLPEARDSLPDWRAAMCGKLSRKALLARPKRGSRESELWKVEEV